MPKHRLPNIVGERPGYQYPGQDRALIRSARFETASEANSDEAVSRVLGTGHRPWWWRPNVLFGLYGTADGHLRLLIYYGQQLWCNVWNYFVPSKHKWIYPIPVDSKSCDNLKLRIRVARVIITSIILNSIRRFHVFLPLAFDNSSVRRIESILLAYCLFDGLSNFNSSWTTSIYHFILLIIIAAALIRVVVRSGWTLSRTNGISLYDEMWAALFLLPEKTF